MFSFLLSVILFVVTIPMKMVSLTAKAVNIAADKVKKSDSPITDNDNKTKKRDTALSKIESKREKGKKKQSDKSKQFIENGKKIIAKSIKSLIAFLRTIASIFAILGTFTTLMTVICALILITVVSSAIVLFNEPLTIPGKKIEVVGTATDEARLASKNKRGNYPFTANASVQQIINMSDSEIWAMISEGNYSSYKEASDAYTANPEECRAFWDGLLETVEVPCWKWGDGNKGYKIQSTVNITVNKYLAEFFKAYMTDLYNCSNQFVIVNIGGYNPRYKNNKDSSTSWSSHSFGVTLDINSTSDGMMSYSATGSDKGIPFISYANLTEIQASEACAYDSSWADLAEQYRLDWGGYWSEGYLDPMHFSVVGDRNKDSRTYMPQADGRAK